MKEQFSHPSLSNALGGGGVFGSLSVLFLRPFSLHWLIILVVEVVFIVIVAY